MRKSVAVIGLLAMAAFIGVSQAERSDAAFHIMRVYGVMGGAGGDADVQYAELRMAAAGQSLVAGHHLCFFDASGAPYARFQFPSSVGNGASGASILVATSEFDAAWAAGPPDFRFTGANTVAIAGGADVTHPIRSPGGKVSFGTDFQATPALMCGGSFALIDSVAYGTAYSGTVDFGTRLNADLPLAGTSAARLQGPVCFPPSCTRDNSTDYAITDVSVPADYPRNNAGTSGPLSELDWDGDGVLNASDNCRSWPNASQTLPPWSIPAGDDDCDGFSASAEDTLGTHPDDACGFTAGGDTRSDVWPVDLVENNTINIFDVLALKTPFGGSVPPVDPRFDLVPNATINIFDVLALKPFFGSTCTP
ncbi:MAG TPA: hypothetical protein VIT93_05400 [Dehalococcoidia bacterium]